MIDLIIGIAMLIFFFGLTAYSTITKDFSYDIKFWLQLLVSGVGSFYILFYQNWDKIKNLFKRKEGDQVVEPVDDKPCDKPCNKPCGKGQSCLCAMLDSNDMRDYSTLVYLRKRAQEMQSQEMLDLVVKLNGLLFSTALQNKV